MNVIYRITDIPSTNPAPFAKDKKELNRVCLASFVDAFRSVRPFIHVIADHCDDGIYKLIEEIVPFEYKIDRTEYGINDTMVYAYEIARDMDDYVLFQECDYLYRPNIGFSYLKALSQLDIVSPYDHKNFYLDRAIHSSSCEIELVDNHHYRSTERNTMTWATHSDTIKENFDMLCGHGYLDDQVWRDLLISGCTLWVPMLSFATHMVEDYMAPGVNWEEIWQKYQ